MIWGDYGATAQQQDGEMHELFLIHLRGVQTGPT